MSAKFQLVPKSTFKHTVTIPRPGDDDAELQFTFNHMSIKKLNAEQKEFAAKHDKIGKIKDEEKRDAELSKLQVEFIKVLASGWEVEDDFSDENISFMLDNYPRAFDSITTQYQAELWAVRQKR